MHSDKIERPLLQPCDRDTPTRADVEREPHISPRFAIRLLVGDEAIGNVDETHAMPAGSPRR